VIMTVDAVYLASMFDHRGGVYISKTLKKIPADYRLDLVFTNQDPTAFYEFRDKLNFLGNVRRDGTSWRWVISSTAALDLLLPIDPYLRLKKEEVELALRFLATVQLQSEMKTRLTPEVLELREYCYQKMKKMKLEYAKGGTNDD